MGNSCGPSKFVEFGFLKRGIVGTNSNFFSLFTTWLANFLVNKSVLLIARPIYPQCKLPVRMSVLVLADIASRGNKFYINTYDIYE